MASTIELSILRFFMASSFRLLFICETTDGPVVDTQFASKHSAFTQDISWYLCFVCLFRISKASFQFVRGLTTNTFNLLPPAVPGPNKTQHRQNAPSSNLL
uniref:Uncharacterized protein n=1 Tax=Ciona intestinalis TaxID=7719 RepID=H2XTC1_CIOIN